MKPLRTLRDRPNDVTVRTFESHRDDREQSVRSAEETGLLIIAPIQHHFYAAPVTSLTDPGSEEKTPELAKHATFCIPR